MNAGVPPLDQRSHQVDPGLTRQLALVLFRYRITRPVLVFLLLLEVAIGVLLVSLGQPFTATIFFVIVVALVGVQVANIPVMDRTMAARGYRPGSTLTAAWYPDRFTITSELASATYPFDETREIRKIEQVVLIRTTDSRLILVLPADLVPEAAFEAIASSIAARRRGPTQAYAPPTPPPSVPPGAV